MSSEDQAPEAVFTTSCRAAPRLPSIMSADVQAKLERIWQVLPVGDSEVPYHELQLRAAVRYLCYLVANKLGDRAAVELAYVGGLLSIELPADTAAGEAGV